MTTTDCRRTVERLPAYVEQALPPAEQADVERHLAVCVPCRSAAVAERGGRTILREKAAALRAAPLPPGLRSRCEALARAHAEPAAPRRLPRLVPVSLTAVLVLFTALAVFSLATARSNTLLAAQLTADHAKCFHLFAGPGSATDDAAALERMLLERYGWDVRLPRSSAAAGVQLIGARRCLYADGRLPHVLYRVNGQDMSLYMLDGVTRPEAEVTSLGHTARIWSRGARTYVMVASSGAGEMTRAARYMMQEAH